MTEFAPWVFEFLFLAEMVSKLITEREDSRGAAGCCRIRSIELIAQEYFADEFKYDLIPLIPL